MRTLVTGGAGFIGSHLVERLLADGHQVTVADNFSTGRIENLKAVRDHPRLGVVTVDVSDSSRTRGLCANVDWVFHLAALADIVPSIRRPLEYHRVNVDGTLSILEAARLAGVKRFVYAASSSCYGVPDRVPTPEEAPIRAMYPYALTKNVGEQYVLHWWQTYRLPCVSLRLFNVYGPRACGSGSYGAVFGVFLAQKAANRPFTVVGDGEQRRDFTFVSDVVEAFVRVAQSNLEGEILNVGSGHAYSINHLVGLLGGEVEYIPKRPGEPDCTWADVTRISTRLGWGAAVGFDQGVKILLRNLDDFRDAPVWDAVSIAEATCDWFEYLGAPRGSDESNRT
ncbi:MAG: SDR family oxidoreductase [Acidobacteriota bacterium]